MKINGIDIELEPGLELIIEDEGRRLRVRLARITATPQFNFPVIVPMAPPLRVEPLRTLPVPNRTPSTGDPMPIPPTIYCDGTL